MSDFTRETLWSILGHITADKGPDECIDIVVDLEEFATFIPNRVDELEFSFGATISLYDTLARPRKLM